MLNNNFGCSFICKGKYYICIFVIIILIFSSYGKIFLFVVLICLLLTSSCKNDDPEPETVVNNSAVPTGTISNASVNTCVSIDVEFSDSDGFVKYVQVITKKDGATFFTGVKTDVEGAPSKKINMHALCFDGPGTYTVYVKLYDNTGAIGTTNTLTHIKVSR